MADLIAAWARTRPHSPAVREPAGGTTLTYRELWDTSGWLAAELSELGIRKGDIVAVDLPRSADMVVAFLGIIRAGGAYLPLDVHAPVDRISDVLTESGARVVVCTDSGFRVPTAAVRSLPIPRHATDGRTPTATTVGDDPIYLIYTSGSTGRPKGVLIPHRGVLRLVTSPNFYTIGPADCVAGIANPAFDATTWEVWGALTGGATFVPLPDLAALGLDNWLALLREERITTLLLTTAVFHTVARERPDAFGELREILVGGEQLDLTIARRVLAAGPPGRLVNCYGPTECSVVATYFECTEPSLAAVRQVPIGYPVQQTQLLVCDDESAVVRPGEVGELCLAGPGLAIGYLGRRELTDERFTREPASGIRLYRTGDLVRQLPDGALEMIGRRDRQVKLRGFRVELEEIERAAVATGEVDAAFVAKVGDDATAALVGFVLPASRPTSAADLPGVLSARLAERLPGYLMPSRWIVLSEVPLSPTGKADRAAMLAMLTPDSGLPAATSSADPPNSADPATSAVRAILLEVLDRPDISTDADFVALGGNSILAVRAAHRIRRRLALPVEPGDVLGARSMTALIEQLERTSAR